MIIHLRRSDFPDYPADKLVKQVTANDGSPDHHLEDDSNDSEEYGEDDADKDIKNINSSRYDHNYWYLKINDILLKYIFILQK